MVESSKEGYANDNMIEKLFHYSNHVRPRSSLMVKALGYSRKVAGFETR
jgi:hypothetical protein